MKKLIIASAVAAVMLASALPVFAGPAPKVDICHVPPGNPANAHTITVSENAIPAHLAHGDDRGACGGGGE